MERIFQKVTGYYKHRLLEINPASSFHTTFLRRCSSSKERELLRLGDGERERLKNATRQPNLAQNHPIRVNWVVWRGWGGWGGGASAWRASWFYGCLADIADAARTERIRGVGRAAGRSSAAEASWV